MGQRIIGIDLGSTFSAIAYVDKNGVPTIIPNREGERITPSVVYFDGGTPIVGTIAKSMCASAPLNVAQYVKRQMGNRIWKMQTENGNAYTPEEISACILKRLKEDAETGLNEVITDAVITVPAYFNDTQRQATKDAAYMAGLNVVHILNEPTAAALAYGLKQNGAPQTVLVFDLGGGTFDVTILNIENGDVAVVATGGDKNLGGFDWDNCLMNHLNEVCTRDGGMDLLENPLLEADLRAKCELAKKTLSGRDKASVLLPIAGKSILATITCSEFEELTKPLFKRTLNITEFVLEDAKLSWADINKILLVGGSTRMKGVARWIREISGITPSNELHPDEVVAMGAAVQAAILQRDNGSLVLLHGVELPIVRARDVNSHSLGVIVVDSEGNDYNSIILSRNTEIPCCVSDQFLTVADQQTEIHVQVTQGEDRDPSYIEIIGHATISLPPYPKGSPVEVIFEYDYSGQIHVSVKDLVIGKMLGKGFTVFVRKSNLSPEKVEQKRDALAHLTVN